MSDEHEMKKFTAKFNELLNIKTAYQLGLIGHDEYIRRAREINSDEPECICHEINSRHCPVHNVREE